MKPIHDNLKAIPASLPDNVSAFWIENGVTGKIQISEAA